MKDNDGLQESQPRWATEVAELYPPQKQWTEADYFTLPETNRLIELSDGELIMPPHPSHTHQGVLLRLATAFQSFVEAHDLGIIRFAPLPVRLWQGKIREPDLLFVSHAHKDRIGEQAYGPPDLAVEVTSPSTWRTDRGDKFLEYARAGVAEYWLVDTEAKTVEVYLLQQGAYTLLTKAALEKAHSHLLAGFELPVSELFK